VPVETSADVLDATAFGDSGIVMGFGYVGMELAPYLAEAAGMDLTVIEHDARPLDEADAPFGDAVMEYYRDAFGIDMRTHTHEKRVRADLGNRLRPGRAGDDVDHRRRGRRRFAGRPSITGRRERAFALPRESV
jgi:dihydrolipoamide dehydrogenase